MKNGFNVSDLTIKGSVVFGIGEYVAENGKKTIDGVIGGITTSPSGEQSVSTKGGVFLHEDILFTEVKDPKTGKITFPVADALIAIGNLVKKNHTKVVKLRKQRAEEAETKAKEKERKAQEREQAKQDYITERLTLAKAHIPLLRIQYKNKVMPRRVLADLERYKGYLEKWEPKSVKDFFPEAK